jgi:hypothetical protein
MQETASTNSPATELICFEVGQVYYANLPLGKAFITVTERSGNKVTARVDGPTTSGVEITPMSIHRHTNANGVMVECITVENRLSWADLDASTVFGEEWVACYLENRQ